MSVGIISERESFLVPRAQYEALMAAAKLFLRGYPSATEDNTDPKCNCYSCKCERAAVALRAAGIQIEKQP